MYVHEFMPTILLLQLVATPTHVCMYVCMYVGVCACGVFMDNHLHGHYRQLKGGDYERFLD